MAETIKAVQGRGDPPAILTQPRDGGDGHARMGALVQPPPTAGPIGDIPPAEAEAVYYRQQAALPKAA